MKRDYFSRTEPACLTAEKQRGHKYPLIPAEGSFPILNVVQMLEKELLLFPCEDFESQTALPAQGILTSGKISFEQLECHAWLSPCQGTELWLPNPNPKVLVFQGGFKIGGGRVRTSLSRLLMSVEYYAGAAA